MEKNTRSASKIHVGGLQPSGDPFCTHFGLTPMGLQNESWPMYQKASKGFRPSENKVKPMQFICQINISNAPYVPLLLQDIKLITFFIGEDFIEHDQYELRAYKDLENLHPLEKPYTDTDTELKGFECQYEKIKDQPKFDDPDLILPPGKSLSDHDVDDFISTLNNQHYSKIGGYSSNIQSEPWWDYQDHPAKPKYCLQIDSEEKANLMWGDSGTIFVARGTAEGYKDRWFVDCQFY